MKKALLLFAALVFAIGLSAQTEVTIDFNDFLEDTDLNGQHGWIAHPHSAGTGGNDIYTGYFGPRGMTTPDESIGVFSVCSGTSYGDIATRVTKDIDAAQGADLDAFIVRLDEAVAWANELIEKIDNA